jgi:hypothetical protein
VLIASRALTSVILAIVIVVVIVLIGRVAYGVHLPGSTIPVFALDVAVGAACFCCLAFAFATFIPSEDAAQPTLQAITLPLYSSPACSSPPPSCPRRSRTSRASSP